MKTKNSIYSLIIIGCALALKACTTINYPDLNDYESFQISNTSSPSVILRFYEADTPKTIYAKIFDGPFVKDLESNKTEVPCDSLWSGHELMLLFGQTALLYSCNNHHGMTAVPMQMCGQGTSLHLFRFSLFIGDSCTSSINGSPYEVLPLYEKELWETWYDEKNYIYYHLWRITEKE